jgi:NAD(P)-dependent dehydrogenase (short-subunit alcohol dehydrogenase family)
MTAPLALVTGAGSGIGAATAARLGLDGWAVACLDIDEGRAIEVAGRLQGRGIIAHPVTADVSDRDAVDAVFAMLPRYGRLGAVVSNAGVVHRQTLLDTSDEVWDATMAVNVRGAFHIARNAAQHLDRGGSLVFVASVVAHIGMGLTAYTASKGALVAMTRALAGELAAGGLRVNAVSPGTVEGTRVTAETLADPEIRRRTLAASPLGLIATPDDIAAAIAFLASSEARMITGQCLVVDAGVSAVAGGLQLSGTDR